MATSTVGSLLARLGGADLTAPDQHSSGADRHIQMGLLSLSSSGLAAVSMAFALSDATDLTPWTAVPLGLAWGVIILNLDRLLIHTMKPTNSKCIVFAAMAPPVAMATLVGIVTATPLTLWDFNSEIQAEMAVGQAHTAHTHSDVRSRSPQQTELHTHNARISHLKDLLADGMHNGAAYKEKLAPAQPATHAQLAALRDERTKIQDSLNRRSLSDTVNITDGGIHSRIEALMHPGDQYPLVKVSYFLFAGLMTVTQLLPVLVTKMTILQTPSIASASGVTGELSV